MKGFTPPTQRERDKYRAAQEAGLLERVLEVRLGRADREGKRSDRRAACTQKQRVEKAMYDDFASVYDTLMDDFDYDEWSRHYLRLIRLATGELPRPRGRMCLRNGSLTVRLAQSGMAMTGVDLSAAMLRQAEKKARDYGVEAAFVRQDMKKTDPSAPRRRCAGNPATA